MMTSESIRDQQAVDRYYNRPVAGKGKGKAPGKLVVTEENGAKHLTFFPKADWKNKGILTRIATAMGLSKEYSSNVGDMAKACQLSSVIINKDLAKKMERYNRWHPFNRIGKNIIDLVRGSPIDIPQAFKRAFIPGGPPNVVMKEQTSSGDVFVSFGLDKEGNAMDQSDTKNATRMTCLPIAIVAKYSSDDPLKGSNFFVPRTNALNKAQRQTVETLLRWLDAEATATNIKNPTFDDLAKLWSTQGQGQT